MKTDLASIPGVDKILANASITDLITRYGRLLVTDEIRIALQEIRTDVMDGGNIPSMNEIVQRVSKKLSELTQFSIKPVINATGVILHTNLGRAPFSQNAIESMIGAAKSYSTLEYDLNSGSRSKRTIHVEALFAQLFGVEDSLVVNNNAAAIMLILSAMANRKKVIISRGQIVEIGGGFRIPDILKLSGARLVEIGTTNQVHLEDYEKAIADGGDLILVVHPSNYRIAGYSSEPSLEGIVKLAQKHGIPIVEDLGSGAILDTAEFGLAHEPTVQESLKAGVDLVCFSGDKLLGGPQAGCILGKSKYLRKIKKHPLARVVRADKLLITSLEATLQSYLFNRPLDDIPIWNMIGAGLDGLKNRAETWIQKLGEGNIQEGRSTIGGGSMPEEEMPTWMMTLRVDKPDLFMKLLREQAPAVIARIQDGLVCFDPRTILPEQDTILVSCISRSLQLYRDNKTHEKTNR